MSNEIEKIETENTEITVSKEQLKNLILINKQLVNENERYKKATASAVNIFSFIKNNVFKGKIPDKMSLSAMVRAAKNIYFAVEDLKEDEAQMQSLSNDFTNLKNLSTLLDDNQVKAISNNE